MKSNATENPLLSFYVQYMHSKKQEKR